MNCKEGHKITLSGSMLAVASLWVFGSVVAVVDFVADGGVAADGAVQGSTW